MARRLAAILAGDVVGYSRQMAEDEGGTYGRLRKALDEVVQPAIARHGGHVFKTTGDGFLAAFGSVGEALDSALAIQAGLAGGALQLRLGLNLGDVIEENGDVFGDGVNLAARLEAMAEPGTVYCSAAVTRSAGARKDLRFERIGRRRGKNMPDAIEVYRVRAQTRPPRRVSWPGGRTWATAAAAALVLFMGGGAAWLDGRLPAALLGALSGGGVAVAHARPAVAVLPLENFSADPDQDYFTDGLTEDIINDLARTRELLVIARNSTFAFKGQSTDVRAIGRQLGAGYVVEGSVRRSGDQLRVVAQLIDADDGTHLWSKSYDRRVEDVFEVQDDLTREIVASLVTYVRDSESASAAERPTDDPRAYDLVLRGRGRFEHGKYDPAALAESRALFTRAVEMDPGFAMARAYLGLTYIVEQGDVSAAAGSRELLVTGLDHAREALRLEPELAFAYQVLSYGLAMSGDYAGGMRAAERAVELNPSDPDSLMALAKAQVRFGIYEPAVANAEQARRLHPLAPQYYPYVHGQALYAAGRAGAAEEVLADCLLRVPDERGCLRIEAAVLVRLGRVEEARAVVARLIRVEPAFSLSEERAYRRFGDSPLMERFLAELATAGAPEVAGQA